MVVERLSINVANMRNHVSRSLLLRSVKLIKQWHDMHDPNPDPMVFRTYYEHAPEMKEIREALGPYDEMKDEVIEATSRSK
jgi:hypothetical protein